MVQAVRDALKVLEIRGVDVRKYPETESYLEGSPDKFTRHFEDDILGTPYGQRVMKAGHFQSNPYEMKRF